MGLPVEAMIFFLVGGLVVALGAQKYLANRSNRQPERDESVNDDNNISYGGISRRHRQRKNKSRRR